MNLVFNGLGIFWDAPGSNYFELDDEVKELLEKLKNINYNQWRNIRYDVNVNNSKIYNVKYIRNLINIHYKEV